MAYFGIYRVWKITLNRLTFRLILVPCSFLLAIALPKGVLMKLFRWQYGAEHLHFAQDACYYFARSRYQMTAFVKQRNQIIFECVSFIYHS